MIPVTSWGGVGVSTSISTSSRCGIGVVGGSAAIGSEVVSGCCSRGQGGSSLILLGSISSGDGLAIRASRFSSLPSLSGMFGSSSGSVPWGRVTGESSWGRSASPAFCDADKNHCESQVLQCGPQITGYLPLGHNPSLQLPGLQLWLLTRGHANGSQRSQLESGA